MGTPHATLSVAPLVEAVNRAAKRWERTSPGGQGGVDSLFSHPNMLRSYHRAKTRGTISHELADRIIVQVLDDYPTHIYGEDWWQ